MGKSLLFSFTSKFLSAGFNFLLAIVLSQFLGKEGKGICSQFIAIITFIQLFCDVVSGPNLVVLSRKYSTRRLFFLSLTWNFLLSIFLGWIVSLSNLSSTENILLLIGISFLNAQVSSHQHLLTGLEKFNFVSVLNLIQSALILGTTFLLLNKPDDASYLKYLYALFISFLLIWVLGMYLLLNEKPKRNFTEDQKLFSDAFHTGIKNQVGVFLQQINSRISFLLLVPAGLGLFSNACSVVESIWIIATSFSAILFGRIANEASEIKKVSLSLEYFKWTMALALVSCLLLISIPDEFFQWIFGKDFFGISELIFRLAPGILSFSGFIILGHYFSGKADFNKNTIAICGGLLITLMGWGYIKMNGRVADTIFISTLTSLSYFMNFLIILLLFQRETKRKWSEFILQKKDIILVMEQIRKRNFKD